jgi:hypothetical protein
VLPISVLVRDRLGTSGGTFGSADLLSIFIATAVIG